MPHTRGFSNILIVVVVLAIAIVVLVLNNKKIATQNRYHTVQTEKLSVKTAPTNSENSIMWRNFTCQIQFKTPTDWIASEACGGPFCKIYINNAANNSANPDIEITYNVYKDPHPNPSGDCSKNDNLEFEKFVLDDSYKDRIIENEFIDYSVDENNFHYNIKHLKSNPLKGEINEILKSFIFTPTASESAGAKII